MKLMLAKGFSMSPTFCEGDFIQVSQKKARRFLPGDIIVFRYQKQLVAHRLLIRVNGSLFVKGDNSKIIETITQKNYIGMVLAIYNKKGFYKTQGFFYRFFSIYFLLVSILEYFFRGNLNIKKIIHSIFRGRRTLVKILRWRHSFQIKRWFPY